MAEDDLVAPSAPIPGFFGLIQVYVINLKRSADRRAWMQSELGRVGVGAEFLAAADGRRFQARCNAKNGLLSKQEVALVISHRRAWRKLLSSGAAHAVVLEDDVHLGAGFADFLAVDFSRYAFDAIKLETWNSRVWISRRGKPIGRRRLHRLGYEHFGAAAYVVSRAGAHKLLSATRPIVEPVDVTLFGGPALFSKQISVLQLVPAIAIQDCSHPNSTSKRNLASTLHEDRARIKAEVKSRKPRGFLRLEREVLRVSGQIRRWVTLSPTMRRSKISWE
jgi:glycosyl transferase family 25